MKRPNGCCKHTVFLSHNKGDLQAMDMQEFNFGKFKYVIRYPDGFSRGKQYPVILFLHGAGTRGDDINVLKNGLFFTLTGKHREFPFITVAPLCGENTWFDLWESLKDFVREITKFPFADRDRIYLLGTSMGGYAAWQLAMSMPEYFAAVVPVCGGGMYWNAGRLKDVPIWAFHGGKDHVVHVEESVKMVDAVNRNGGKAKLTVYPDNDHDAWSETYSNPEVFSWLLQHRNATTKAFSDGYHDPEIYG